MINISVYISDNYIFTMKKTVQAVFIAGGILALLAFVSPVTSVRADDSGSIINIEPDATPTPDVIQVATSTPEATPENLPTTGTSPILLIGLLAVLLISVRVYFSASPKQK